MGADAAHVLVIGSGAAGLAAALGAVSAGRSVIVLEAADRLGGTSAVSGGAVWLPGHGRGDEISSQADVERVRRYWAAHAVARDENVVDAFFERAPEIVSLLETHTPLRFQPMQYPDSPLRLGVVGTKGGPRIDVDARVLDWHDVPIPGLFAAGNATAAPIGPGTLSNGLSLGLALTFGWIAGTNAAQRRPA